MKTGFSVGYKFLPNGTKTDKMMSFLSDGSFCMPFFGPKYVEKSDLTDIKYNKLIFNFDGKSDELNETEIMIDYNSICCMVGFHHYNGSSHQIYFDDYEKVRMKKWLFDCYGLICKNSD